MGDRSERRFARMFAETHHWWSQRAAASGGATDADLPDVTIAHDGIAFALEEKETSEPYIYVDPGEVRQLQAYAAAYGMRAAIAGRFKGERAFYLWNPADMERTDAGTYRGSPGDECWAIKIAEPDGSVDEPFVYPEELTSTALSHALAGHHDRAREITAAFAPGDGDDDLATDGGETEAEIPMVRDIGDAATVELGPDPDAFEAVRGGR